MNENKTTNSQFNDFSEMLKVFSEALQENNDFNPVFSQENYNDPRIMYDSPYYSNSNNSDSNLAMQQYITKLQKTIKMDNNPHEFQTNLIKEYTANPMSNKEIQDKHKYLLKMRRLQLQKEGKDFTHSKSTNSISFKTKSSSIREIKNSEFKETVIKKMKYQKTHLNEYLVLEITDFPYKVNALQSIGKDKNNDFMFISIYSSTNDEEEEKELSGFTPRRFIIIIEPFFKISTNKTPIIRIESSSDYILLDSRKEVDSFLLVEELSGSSNKTKIEGLRKKGNDLFKVFEFNKAIVIYLEALSLDSTEFSLLSNIAESYLKLGKFSQSNYYNNKCLEVINSIVIKECSFNENESSSIIQKIELLRSQRTIKLQNSQLIENETNLNEGGKYSKLLLIYIKSLH